MGYNGAMNKDCSYNALRYIATIGNVLLILWMLYNGMDEGWNASPVQIASYVFLFLLLALNSALLWRKK
jgi:hypothetical protein